MHVHYDPDADALYIELRKPNGNLVGATPLDAVRYLHHDERDQLVTIELLEVSRGVDLRDLPEAARVASVLRSLSEIEAVG